MILQLNAFAILHIAMNLTGMASKTLELQTSCGYDLRDLYPPIKGPSLIEASGPLHTCLTNEGSAICITIVGHQKLCFSSWLLSYDAG